MSTPRGSRASALREKASAEVRAGFEKKERSLALALSAPLTPRSEALTPRGNTPRGSTPHGTPGISRQASATRVGSALPLSAAAPVGQRAAERRSKTPEGRRSASSVRSRSPTKRVGESPQGISIVGSLALRDDKPDGGHACDTADSPRAPRRRPGSLESGESIPIVRERLAARESALEAWQLRAHAQEVALEASRVSMQAKLDRINELQDSARRQESRLRREEAKIEAQVASWKREKDHMQNRIHFLERQLDEERQQRQALEHKLVYQTEQLLKEQRERSKLAGELEAAKADSADSKLAAARAQSEHEELRVKLQLKTSQLIAHDVTLRQTHMQLARNEEAKKADVFEGYVENLWRNRDIGAIVEGMKRYQRHARALQRGFMALTSLAHDNPACQEQIAAAGGIECACQAMRAHSTNAPLQQQAMRVSLAACARVRGTNVFFMRILHPCLQDSLTPFASRCTFSSYCRRAARCLRWRCTMTTSSS